jgi:hypothetical protein
MPTRSYRQAPLGNRATAIIERYAALEDSGGRGFFRWAATASATLSSDRIEAPARLVLSGRRGPLGRLNSHPPAIATIPSTIWRRGPSPRLVTILRPIKPATRPNKIQLKKDMARSPIVCGCSIGAVDPRLWVEQSSFHHAPTPTCSPGCMQHQRSWARKSATLAGT